jgi:16S rRNA C967 or C1407 C5-methylase (RsmB/RsmF family)
VAVHALSIEPDDQVLDLCCAPGGKLAYISDQLLTSQGPTTFIKGTLTGVDIAEHRLAVCKRICQKYKVQAYRLFKADGTEFGVHAPSRIGSHSRLSSPVEMETMKNLIVKPYHASRLIRADPQLESEALLYDKVLVDAECTHDGSIAHLFTDETVGWKSFESVLSPEKFQGIEKLQVCLYCCDACHGSALTRDGMNVYREDSYPMVHFHL